MSRTDKDVPLKYRTPKIINHSHERGICIPGTWEDARKLRALLWRHYRKGECARYTWEVLCIHDAERVKHQRNVDHARASQKGRGFLSDFDSNEPSSQFTPARGKSATAIYEMLKAGRYPNCDADRTHLIDLRTYDLRLIPGESTSSIFYRFGSYPVYSPPGILKGPREKDLGNFARFFDRPKLDPSASCRFCDDHPDITCYYEPGALGYRRRGCSCCDDGFIDDTTSVRSLLRGYVREYNTFGCINDA